MHTLLALGSEQKNDVIFCPYCKLPIHFRGGINIEKSTDNCLIYCNNNKCGANEMLLCLKANYASNYRFVFNYNPILNSCAKEIGDDLFSYCREHRINLGVLNKNEGVKFYKVHLVKITELSYDLAEWITLKHHAYNFSSIPENMRMVTAGDIIYYKAQCGDCKKTYESWFVL